MKNAQKHAEMKERIARLFYLCVRERIVYHRVSHDPLRHPALLENLIEKNLLTEDLCPKCEKKQRQKSMEFWHQKKEEVKEQAKNTTDTVWPLPMDWGKKR